MPWLESLAGIPFTPPALHLARMRVTLDTAPRSVISTYPGKIQVVPHSTGDTLVNWQHFEMPILILWHNILKLKGRPLRINSNLYPAGYFRLQTQMSLTPIRHWAMCPKLSAIQWRWVSKLSAIYGAKFLLFYLKSFFLGLRIPRTTQFSPNFHVTMRSSIPELRSSDMCHACSSRRLSDDIVSSIVLTITIIWRYCVIDRPNHNHRHRHAVHALPQRPLPQRQHDTVLA